MKRGTVTVWRWLAVLALGIGAADGRAAGTDTFGAVLQPFVDDHTLAGAVVLAANREKILALEAVGWMDVAGRRPMRTDCVFWVASQSKPITAAALMILVDEGRVSVDDPVEKHLPEFKGQMFVAEQDDGEHQLLQKPRHPILVREILSHTSGLPFKTPIEQPALDLYPLELRVRSYAMTPLLFEPGTKSQYSNAGINTAGRIIEVVSGMPFERFLEERLCRPLGMSDTTFWPDAGQLARLARAYRPNAARDGLEEVPIAQLTYPLDGRERRPMPGGGLFSTAGDMARFYRMLANDGALDGTRVLSERSVRALTSDQSGEARSNYGLGFAVNGRTFGHGGAYNTHSRYDREHQLVSVFLVQHAGWTDAGKKILPAFQEAATERFGTKPESVEAVPRPVNGSGGR